ncbi:MAG: hypothetical protein DDG59_08310 [Anaerolineae bacterium]|jgi:glycosyltransferase involved in cell wall biosynthesis|nr:MAG: hypothetical protein DDG59_08310 [Anaerolineae bacterium]
MTLSLSVIICTKDRPQDLQQCLDSILTGKRLPDEIIIIDDGDLNAARLQQMILAKGIKLIYRHKSPPNVNASRNLAVTLASGDILSFLDDDVILDQAYYDVVMKAFEEDQTQSIAGITGVIDIHTNPIKRLFLRFFGLESNQPGKVQASGAVTLVRKGEIDTPTKVEWLSGCNMNFRRWVFEDTRFDERDSGYIWGDDRDFTYPLGKKYTLIALPKASLIHKKSPISRGSAKNLGRMEIFHLGRFFIAHKAHQAIYWIALIWAFFGILLKNLLMTLNPRKTTVGIQQFVGNLEGLLEFSRFLTKKYGDKTKC